MARNKRTTNRKPNLKKKKSETGTGLSKKSMKQGKLEERNVKKGFKQKGTKLFFIFFYI